MHYEIIDSPDFALLSVTLDEGEQIVSEAGAMVAMSDRLDMQTNMRGGLLAAAKRKLLGGESLFQNTYTARAPGQRLMLAPAPEGDLRARELGPGEQFFLQSGCYVAHTGADLVLDTKWGGVRSFFGGVGFFMLRITGPGTVFYYSYGAMHTVDVGPAGYICDTGHIVGFDSTLRFEVRKFGGLKSLFFSGEGLVCHFSGQGQLELQTRNAGALAAFLEPYRPVRRGSDD